MRPGGVDEKHMGHVCPQVCYCADVGQIDQGVGCKYVNVHFLAGIELLATLRKDQSSSLLPHVPLLLRETNLHVFMWVSYTPKVQAQRIASYIWPAILGVR